MSIVIYIKVDILYNYSSTKLEDYDMKKKAFILPAILISLALSACSFQAGGNSSLNSSETNTSSSQTTIPVQSINLNTTSMELIKGKKGEISIKSVMPKNATDKSVNFSSTNESVATVDQKGIVTAIEVGSASIIVKANDGSNVSAPCSVTVIENKVDSAFKKATKTLTYNDLDTAYNVNSFGNQKVLVLPVYFSNDKEKATADNRTLIEKSFFGTDEDCGWRSYKSYYEHASYNQVHFIGHVADWYASPYTTSQVSESVDLSRQIVSDAVGNFKKTNPSFDWSGYDQNNDGYIDQVSVIYATDYEQRTGSDITGLWGFRWQTTISDGMTGLEPYAFTWFSLKFLTNTKNYGGVPDGGLNTKIIIHEHGHMLGLSDYYDTTYAGSVDYVGSYDMQSNNVLDWNAFSKYSVGWVNPYYLDENIMKTEKTATITIGSSSLDGDCILVKGHEWNGMPFDEYLLIELFNPYAGNNAWDCTKAANGLGKGGIRIYHVDARCNGLPDYDSFNPNYSYRVKYDNDYSESEYHLLHLLQKGGTNTFGQKGQRDKCGESDLFKTGDSFCLGTHEGFRDYGTGFFLHETTFNDGNSLPYGIHFDKVTSSSATITFTYFE